MKVKKISALISIIMIFTMVFSSGSVFANGRDQGPPSTLGNFLRIESAGYIATSSGKTIELPVVAIYQNGAIRLTADDCYYTVDHPDVVKVEDGQFVLLKKGIATVNVYAYGTSTQITFELLS